MTKTLLALSPHTDDAELGAGGSLARWIEEGWTVHVVVFSRCEASLPAGAAPDLLEREFHNSMEALGVPASQRRVLDYPVRRFPEFRQPILEQMVALRKELGPDQVLVPSADDHHQDHQTIHEEGVRAFRTAATLFGYELLWNMAQSRGQHYVRLEQRHLDLKAACLACYESQTSLGRPYFQTGLVQSLAAVRGMQVGSPFAECFEVLRSRE